MRNECAETDNLTESLPYNPETFPRLDGPMVSGCSTEERKSLSDTTHRIVDEIDQRYIRTSIRH